ncbi:MAG TPA: hypothetical protein VMR21_04870, partial [Vicinamibacteria bacterium]|nr:hypothetical protein [Vicinamibacteria bacterium]
DPAPLGALAGVLLAAHWARGGGWRSRARRVGAALALAAAAVLGTVATLRSAPALDPGEVAAMEWVRTHTRVLDVVCADDGPQSAWIPAVAGRAVESRPPSGGPARGGPCAVSMAFSGVEGPRAIAGAVAFRSASSVVWTNDGKR